MQAVCNYVCKNVFYFRLDVRSKRNSFHSFGTVKPLTSSTIVLLNVELWPKAALFTTKVLLRYLQLSSQSCQRKKALFINHMPTYSTKVMSYNHCVTRSAVLPSEHFVKIEIKHSQRKVHLLKMKFEVLIIGCHYDSLVCWMLC